LASRIVLPSEYAIPLALTLALSVALAL